MLNCFYKVHLAFVCLYIQTWFDTYLVFRAEGDHEDDEELVSETPDKLSTNSASATKKLPKEKLEYGMKYPPIERQLNTKINEVNSVK